VKTIAIIQARMGSTRLPGKVMMDLGGHKVLDWVVYRVSKAKLVDAVVVAIPQRDVDSELGTHCHMKTHKTFYGPEDDVLARYYHCAKHYDADYIVRITADCPLVSWETIDACIARLWMQPFSIVTHALVKSIEALPTHYVSNALKNKYLRGLDVEVFTMQMLTIAYHAATYEFQREHVTPFMANRDGAIYQSDSGEYSHLRWTLDEQADLDMLRELVKHGNMDTPWQEFAQVCKQHPEIPKINAHVKQKEAR